MACFFSLCCACEVVLKFAVRYIWKYVIHSYAIRMLDLMESSTLCSYDRYGYLAMWMAYIQVRIRFGYLWPIFVISEWRLDNFNTS